MVENKYIVKRVAKLIFNQRSKQNHHIRVPPTCSWCTTTIATWQTKAYMGVLFQEHDDDEDDNNVR